jgi:hypothetical protein
MRRDGFSFGRGRGDKGEVDEILGAGARPMAFVGTGVHVELLCNLELERYGLHLDGRYLCEGEEAR